MIIMPTLLERLVYSYPQRVTPSLFTSDQLVLVYPRLKILNNVSK